ncbi:MAG: DNA polymerase domain-containing protein, partial [Pseudomonadota bacterium]
SIIRTFNIDPLGYHQALQNPGSHVYTHDGTAFVSASPDQTVEVGDLADAGELSILPDMLDRLFPQRDEAKARGDAVASQAIKILMNSFYGVLGTPACRFYNPAIANAITSQGRHLLGWSKQWFEERGYAVLYGDTDSVFVASGCSTGEQAMSLAPGLVADFNAGLADYLQTRYGVVSRLQMEFEKLYSKLFLASVRGGSQGARKRYAGLRYTPETPETPETRTSPDAQVADSQALEFVGMEVVRRDWTELAKQVQKNLFARLFHGDEVAQYLHSVVAQLRAGELDDLLVYHKGLRKPVDSYTTNIPPHVQAVKKSSVEPPRLVAYVITEQGPELAAEQRHPLDREHYLQRQVQPVAEPVLEALGLNFNQVIGDDRQIDLFG